MANTLRYQPSYRRNLPHIQPLGATFFVTPRLYGSLPGAVLEQLHAETEQRLKAIKAIADPETREAERYWVYKRQFGRLDALLDCATKGPMWLAEPAIATLLCEAFHYRDGRVYELIAFCVMSNHAHVVFTPLCQKDGSSFALSQIMHSLKGYSAHKANGILGREGHFWQEESYDHYVRDAQELQRIVWYVLNNPVKAGLVDEWSKWPWTYWKYAELAA